MADAANLWVLLGLKDQMTAGLDKAKASVEDFASKLKPLGVAFTAVGASITAITGLAVKSSLEQQVGINRLDQALKNVGESYKGQQGAIEAVISAQQRKTNFSDEQQRDALQKLVTVGGQWGGSLEALKITTDVAAGANIDLNAAALLVGKAIAGETSSLSRYGIVLKEGASQTEIMAALTRQFGGAAEAAANPMTQLKNRLDDMMQVMGNALLPIVTQAAKLIGDIAVKVQAWAEAHPQLAKMLAIVAAALGAVMVVVGPLLIALPAIIAGVAAFGVALQVAMGPVGLITLAITGLVVGAVLLWKNWDTVWSGIKRVTEMAVNFIIRAINFFSLGIRTQMDLMLLPVQKVVGIFNKDWADAIGKAREALQRGIPAIDITTEKVAELGAVTEETAAKTEESANRMTFALRQVAQELEQQAKRDQALEKTIREGAANAREQFAADLAKELQDNTRLREEAAKEEERVVTNLGENLVRALKARLEQEERLRMDAWQSAIEDAREAGRLELDFVRETTETRIEEGRRATRILTDLADERISAIKREERATLDALAADLDALDMKTGAATGAIRQQIEGLQGIGTRQQQNIRRMQLETAVNAASFVRGFSDDQLELIAAGTQGASELTKDAVRALLDLRNMERQSAIEGLRIQEQGIRDAARNQSEAIRNQIALIKMAADTKATTIKRELELSVRANADMERSLRSNLESQLAQITKHTEAVVKDLETRRDTEKQHWEKLKQQDQLEAEARRLILAGDQEAILQLLDSFAPGWETAGKTFGERLLAGIGSKMAGITNLLAQLNLLPTQTLAQRVMGAGPGGLQLSEQEISRLRATGETFQGISQLGGIGGNLVNESQLSSLSDAQIAAQQAEYDAANAAGQAAAAASAAAHEAMNSFQHGGIVPGPIGKPLAAIVHGGERVIPVGGTHANTPVINIALTVNGDINGMDDFTAKVTRMIRDAVLGGAFKGILVRA